MKYLIKLLGLILLFVILITCRDDEPTEEERLNQLEQKIIENVNGFMPEQIGLRYKDYFNNNRGQKDYGLYLDSIEIALDELKSAIQLNFTLDEFKKAFNNSLTTLESSNKGSLNNCLGLGYAKGVSLQGGLSGAIGSIIVMGLQASGGGGIKTIYDYVNLRRQIYSYTFCGSGVSFGAGIAAALKANVGFSGINEIITGIRYHGDNSILFPYEGQSIGKSFSLDPQIGFAFGGGVGIGLSIGIGTSSGAVADFTGTSNLSFCPGYKVEIENGTTSYSFKVNGTISAIAGFADIGAYLSLNTTMTNSVGVSGTNTNFSSNRTLAGIRMATEITITGPMDGIVAIPGPIDLAASTIAIIYSFKDFSTCPPEIPAIGTKTVGNISSTSAICGGIIKDDRGANVTVRGVVWSKSENPSITDKIGITNDGQGTGGFISNISNLSASTTYYLRAYATNSAGTSYGTQVSFTTPLNITKPTVSTTAITNFNSTSATVGGNVTSSGGATVTERGVYWGTSPNPESTGTKLQIGSGTGTFSATLPGLNPSTLYYVNAYAINSQGTSYGTQVSFTTLAAEAPPIAIFNAFPTTMSLGGNAHFVDQSTNNPTSWLWNFGDGMISTSKDVYYQYLHNGVYTVSLIVTNEYGSDTITKPNYITVNLQRSNGIIFNPSLTYGTFFHDYDETTYYTIQIGSQVWMAENLSTTHLSDGTRIPFVSDSTEWSTLTTPAYCVYNNDGNNEYTYGLLYNWYAVNTGMLCPTGWHVPTIEEWQILRYPFDVGLGNIAGAELMEQGTTHWNRSDIIGTNETGFTALPAGYRSRGFGEVGNVAKFWEYAESPYSNDAFYYPIPIPGIYGQSPTTMLMGKKDGLSVRCLKDN